MKKKTGLILGIWLLISVIWLVGLFVIVSRENFNWKNTTIKTAIESIYFDEKSGVAAVNYTNIEAEKPVDVQENFIIVPRYSIENLYDGDTLIEYGKNRMKVNYFYIDLFLLETGKPNKQKSIDVKKLINEVDPSLDPVYYEELLEIDEQRLLGISVYNHETGNEYGTVYINLETKEVLDSDAVKIERTYSNPKLDLVNRTNFYSLIKESGISPYHYSGGEAFIIQEKYGNEDSKKTRNKDWSDIHLLRNQQRLRNFFDVTDGEKEAILFFTKEPTSEELMEWLYPINKDPFEKLTLDRIASTDEEEHAITSVEDFNTWYKYSENNYENTIKKEKQEQAKREAEQEKAQKDSE